MWQGNVLDMFHGDNREAMPDFAYIRSQGIWAVIHKASQGMTVTDHLYSARIEKARGAGLLVGSYHFGTDENATEQVDRYLEITKAKPGDFVCLDWERNPDGHTMSLRGALEFLTALRVDGFNPVIYGSDFVRENAKALNAPVLNSGWWLWLAEYGPHMHIPLPWGKATTLLWQFSGRGTFRHFNGHVDMNYFDGTADELSAKWGKPCGTIATPTATQP